MNEELIEQMKQQALIDKVPIMEQEGIDYLKEWLLQHHIQSLLEVGTAIGYSSIVFASWCPELSIVTLEKDESRYLQAKENIAKANLQGRIETVLTDAREYQEERLFDAIFLDGPKAHNQELFDHYLKNLKPEGWVIIDDVWFHGLIDDPGQIKTRRVRTMVRKLGKFRDDMLSNPDYESEYLQIGDGVLICKRRNKDE